MFGGKVVFEPPSIVRIVVALASVLLMSTKITGLEHELPHTEAG
jgi:hypothetical protein